jgi:hypothetical protein
MTSIENLIITSLKEFNQLACITELKKVTESKLIFPVKRDGKKRVSEQEARFVFVKYRFLGANERSGNFDICLYENGMRKHLVEFKGLNPKQSSYSKDFEKLLYDESDLDNYFIQVLESINNGTIPNIESKYAEAIENVKSKNRQIRSNLNIYLCVIGYENILQYRVDKKRELVKLI